MDRSEGFTI